MINETSPFSKNGNGHTQCLTPEELEIVLAEAAAQGFDIRNGPAPETGLNGAVPHHRLTDTHRAALHSRGLTDATIVAAGLYSGDAAEVRRVLGYNPNNTSGLIIPYFHPITGALRLCRVRCDNPPVIDGKPAKYLSPRVGNLLYFPPGLNLKGLSTNDMGYFTEGEFKALAAWQHGLPAVASVGVWGWRTKENNSRTIADMDLIPWQDKQWAAVFDSDIALNRDVQKARHAWGKEAYKRGARIVYGITLPQEDGGKTGWDDYFTRHTLDEFYDLPFVDLPPTDLPAFTSPISELLDGPDEPIEWGIEGLQPMGASGWRVANPKVGKSWDMLEEAYCLATGQQVYGHFNVPQKRRVLVIEEEDPKRRFKRRMRRIIHAHGELNPSDEFFRYSVKKGVRLDDSKWQEVIEWEIRQFRPDFVFMDVFSRLQTKDMNSSEDMGRIVDFLDKLTLEYNSAFSILHHNRKNSAGGDVFNEMFGSRVLSGFSEASMHFATTKEKGVLRVHVELKDEPDNGNFEQDFLIRLTDTEDKRGTFFEYLGAPSEQKTASTLRGKILAYVLTLVEPQTALTIGNAVGCSKPTARHHLTALEKDHSLVRTAVGSTQWYGPMAAKDISDVQEDVGV